MIVYRYKRSPVHVTHSNARGAYDLQLVSSVFCNLRFPESSRKVLACCLRRADATSEPKIPLMQRLNKLGH